MNGDGNTCVSRTSDTSRSAQHRGEVRNIRPAASPSRAEVPTLLTPGDVAMSLRTSRKAIYAMIARGQMPGLVRVGRRVLIRADALVDWLRQKSMPSLER